MPTSIWLDWLECQRRSHAQRIGCQHRGMANAETKSQKSPSGGGSASPFVKIHPAPLVREVGRAVSQQAAAGWGKQLPACLQSSSASTEENSD